MTADGANDPTSVKDLAERYRVIREDELLDFIRDTVQQLQVLGDRLESYIDTKETGRDGTSGSNRSG